MRALLIFSITALLLSACSKERFYENVYEGVRVQQQLEKAGSKDAGEEQMTYREYETERKENR
jgi:hypothetical protein